MISNTSFQRGLAPAFVLIIFFSTYISALCFPSQALSIIAISMVATWIFPVVVVIVSPNKIRRNTTIQMYGSMFMMQLAVEIHVWYRTNTSSTYLLEIGWFAAIGQILLVMTGGLLFFTFSMKAAYKANPDTRELDTTPLWPKVVRQCLRALRIHRQHKSDPEYQFLVSVSTDYIPLPFFP